MFVDPTLRVPAEREDSSPTIDRHPGLEPGAPFFRFDGKGSGALGQARDDVRFQTIAIFALLILAAFALRWPSFGNPAMFDDEEFYLLVGDRMLHGVLPYVDIWDRKPVGLFLIYAAIRLLGGDGIVQYQVVAAIFAGCTAAVIALIARRAAPLPACIVSGLAYLLWIDTVEGGGGQSPVFYNLFIAGCALCVFRAVETVSLRRFRLYGFAAMTLAGLAIQVKYTALFEGMYFGLLLTWQALKRERSPVAALGWTVAFAITALVPTLAAIATYAALGHFRDFWYANFVSIFSRAPVRAGEIPKRFGEMVLHTMWFVVCAAASVWQLWRTPDPEVRRWQAMIGGWVIAAFIGFFSIGALFYHYMLPLFVPLAIASAPIFGRFPTGPVLGGLLLWFPFSHAKYPDLDQTAYGRRQIAALVRLIPADVDRGCMQLFAGPSILYKITNACFVTPYIFPNHLLEAKERNAIGVDQVAELKRVMAHHPRVIVTDDTPRDWNPIAQETLRKLRDPAYRHVGQVELSGSPYDVWVRRTPAA